MTTLTPDLHQVDPLSEEQIAQFKRDGLLVLPGVLDSDLCRRAREQMWDIIAAYRPLMKRDDPTSWTPINEEEAESYSGQKGVVIPISPARVTATTSETGPRNYC